MMRCNKTMKKYIKPEMEITEFDVEDVITTSNPTNQGGSEDNGEGKELIQVLFNCNPNRLMFRKKQRNAPFIN